MSEPTTPGVEHWLPWYETTLEAVASIRGAETFAGYSVWQTLDWLNLEDGDLVSMTLERLADRGRLTIDPSTLEHPKAYVAKIALNRLREEVAERRRLGHLEDLDSPGVLGEREAADIHRPATPLIREHRDESGEVVGTSTPGKPKNRPTVNVGEALGLDPADWVSDLTDWLIESEGLGWLVCGDHRGTARGVTVHEERGGLLCEASGGEAAVRFYLTRDADHLLEPEAYEAAVRMRGGFVSCSEFAALRSSRRCEMCSTPFTRKPGENARAFCQTKCKTESRNLRRRSARAAKEGAISR